MKKRPVAVVTPPFNSPFNRVWRATPVIETSTCPQCHRDAAFLVWLDGTWLCSVCNAPAETSSERADTLGG
jgi:ribosomal protein L37AE/L43A